MDMYRRCRLCSAFCSSMKFSIPKAIGSSADARVTYKSLYILYLGREEVEADSLILVPLLQLAVSMNCHGIL